VALRKVRTRRSRHIRAGGGMSTEHILGWASWLNGGGLALVIAEIFIEGYSVLLWIGGPLILLSIVLTVVADRKQKRERAVRGL